MNAIYRNLEYTPEVVDAEVTKIQSSDELVTAIKEIAIKSSLSPDLFESDSEEIKCKISVEKVSVGTQCSPVVEKRITQDVETSTSQPTGIDVGIQTDPFENSFELPEWETIYDKDLSQFDESDVESFSDDIEDETSSSSCLDDFDTLDNLNDNELLDAVEKKIIDCDEPDYIDEVEVYGSPPSNQVYRNRRFHSPDSLKDGTEQ